MSAARLATECLFGSNGEARVQKGHEAPSASYMHKRRTTVDKALAGLAAATSDAYVSKDADVGTKRAPDHVADALKRVDAHRRRIAGVVPDATLSVAEIEGAPSEDHHDELLKAEAAGLLSLFTQ